MTIFFSLSKKKSLFLQVKQSSWELFVKSLEKLINEKLESKKLEYEKLKNDEKIKVNDDLVKYVNESRNDLYSYALTALNEPLNCGDGVLDSLYFIEETLKDITYDKNSPQFWIYNQFLELIETANKLKCSIDWG